MLAHERSKKHSSRTDIVMKRNLCFVIRMDPVSQPVYQNRGFLLKPREIGLAMVQCSTSRVCLPYRTHFVLVLLDAALCMHVEYVSTHRKGSLAVVPFANAFSIGAS